VNRVHKPSARPCLVGVLLRGEAFKLALFFFRNVRRHLHRLGDRSWVQYYRLFPGPETNPHPPVVDVAGFRPWKIFFPCPFHSHSLRMIFFTPSFFPIPVFFSGPLSPEMFVPRILVEDFQRLRLLISGPPRARLQHPFFPLI